MRRARVIVPAMLLVVIVVACVGAGWFAPYPQNHQNLVLGPVGPSWRHLFGTDELGRDQLSELLYAGRITLEIGFGVGLLSTVAGTLVGLVAGYAGRWVDQVLMRVIDLFLIVPAIAVVAIVAKYEGRSDLGIVLALSGLGWMYVARIVRAEVLSIREREYVDAARVSGASHTRVIVRHILPNVMAPIIVSAALSVAVAVLAESALSYLGLGVRLPHTSWGRMIADARGAAGTSKAYLLWFPGLALLLTVLSFNQLGDGLRRMLDRR